MAHYCGQHFGTFLTTKRPNTPKSLRNTQTQVIPPPIRNPLRLPKPGKLKNIGLVARRGLDSRSKPKGASKRPCASSASARSPALPQTLVPSMASSESSRETALLVGSGGSQDSAAPAGGAMGQTDLKQGEDDGEKDWGKGSRWGSWQVLVALCAVSVVICYADRSNISTSILPMSQQYDWDKTEQGIILSAFFAGYCATQLLGGQLADQLGAKRVLTWGVVVWSLCTGLTPAMAALGATPLVAIRVAMGLGEGVAFPAIHSLISRYVPVQNQSTSVGIVTAASYIGAAVAFVLAPLLIERFAWESTFTFFGAAAVLWLPLWLLTPLPPFRPGLFNPGPDITIPPSPTSPATGAENENENENENEEAVPLLIPQRSESAALQPGNLRASESQKENLGFVENLRTLVPLFTRKEVLAICIAQYTGSWGLYGLLNWLPSFFADVYGVEVGSLGAYTFLPYLAQGGVGALAGVLADYLLLGPSPSSASPDSTQHPGWHPRRVRLLLQVSGMIGPAVCLVLASSPQVASTPETAAAFITLGLGLNALTLGGVSANHLDIAPRHAGVVFGAGNTAATLAGFLSVPVTGLILDKTESWALALGLSAAHYVVGAAIYSVLCGGDVLEEDYL